MGLNFYFRICYIRTLFSEKEGFILSPCSELAFPPHLVFFFYSSDILAQAPASLLARPATEIQLQISADPQGFEKHERLLQGRAPLQNIMPSVDVEMLVSL